MEEILNSKVRQKHNNHLLLNI